MRIRHAARTDVGLKRHNNEDSLLATPELRAFGVFDGMGGHAAGEVASRLAAEAASSSLTDAASAQEPLRTRCRIALELANRQIYQHAESDHGQRQMGTTGTLLLFSEALDRAAFGHVGDSRLYRLHDGHLEQLSEDHSLVDQFLRQGWLTPAQAAKFPLRNVILRSLGQKPSVEVDTRELQVAFGDVFLLCSDGLNGMVPDESIEAILQGVREPDAAAERLIEAANARGGVDNITAVVVAIEG